jgi:hypothetical protein
MSFDLVLRGGTLYDGSGQPPAVMFPERGSRPTR